MKIKTIQAFPLTYPEPHYNNVDRYITLARIETEDGIVAGANALPNFAKRRWPSK